jgi:hypothetical protein
MLEALPQFQKIRGNMNRIFKTFMTCELAERCCRWVKKTHGRNAFALFISISFDSAAANTSQTRSQCPLSFQILNCVNEDLKFHLLGYMPIHSSYSKDELIEWLKNGGCTVKKRQETIIKSFDRQCQVDFIYDVLEPILSTHDDGMLFQIGAGPDAKIVKLYVYVVKFIVDIVGSDVCSNCGYQRKNMFCRMCCSKDRWDFGSALKKDHVVEWRNSIEMETAGKKQVAFLQKKFDHDCAFSKQRNKSLKKQNIKKTADEMHWEKIAKEKSISICDNRLYEHCRPLERAGLHSYHLALGPEMLHILDLGAKKNGVSTVVSLISIYSTVEALIIKPKKFCYQDSMGILDFRTKNFPALLASQTFFPVRLALLRKGFSELIGYCTVC